MRADLHAECLARAAAERGLRFETVLASRKPEAEPRPWLRLYASNRVYYYRLGVLRIAGPTMELAGARHINHRIVRLTSDKSATKAALERLGVPVAPGRQFAADAFPAAAAFLEELGRPVCVKPNAGGRGTLVFPAIADRASLARVFPGVARYGPVVVEEHLPGEAVRMLYMKPRVVGVRLGRPASVIGDGRRTIRQLVDAKNEERHRRRVPGHVPIILDDETDRYLSTQHMDLDGVPPPGRRVFLRGTSNMPTGGDCIDCRAGLPPSYVAEVERFCRALPGLTLAAIDLMIEDIGREATPRNHWVLELNSAPGLVSFHFPWEGRPQDVSGALVDRLAGGGWS